MILLYLLGLLLMGIYSYSQIDLNLTLFQDPLFLYFKSLMINLGYYNRPLSAGILLGLLLSLFGGYLWLLRKGDKLSTKTIILGIVGIGIIGLVSYPAFSYDFFNYLFDARIVSVYGQNPYFAKPQDFVGDSWLRFMHWVHRTYPYGPGWLITTVPLSVIGNGKFIATAVLFKFGFVANYFLGIYLLWLITKSKRLVIFYAFNPLVIIESVLSPHLDALMATLLLTSFLFYQRKRLGLSIIFNLLSASIKFVTFVTLPFLFWKWPLDKVARFSLVTIAAVLAAVIVQREFYPWYLLPLLATAAVMTTSSYIRPMLIALSLGLVLQYLPYIYWGVYSSEVQTAKIILLLLPIIVWSIFAKKLSH